MVIRLEQGKNQLDLKLDMEIVAKINLPENGMTVKMTVKDTN